MPEVLIAQQGSVGRITLNRPAALNALTLEMIREIAPALTEWSADPAVKTVLLDGAGERGLCAGGDIRHLYDAAKSGDYAFPAIYWREEYALNTQIKRFPKPYIALMDGITMGGGIGLSAHGSHRVVTERSVIAMPEVGIGMIPDVGGTYLLSRAPGELGTYAALTGARLGTAGSILCGLADVYLPSSALPGIADRLQGCASARDVADVLGNAPAPEPGMMAGRRPWVDACFGGESVPAILHRLQERPEPEARESVGMIRGRSPSLASVTLRALRQARTLPDLEACLRVEYILAMNCVRRHDFVEGVRAAVIDKDRKPRWSPPTAEEVSPEMVDAYFEAPSGLEPL